MLIGVIGTSVIHMSKGLMKLGLLKLRASHFSGGSRRTATAVYTTGMILNFTTPFWVMVANVFAPTVFYTSMYGSGLIALLIFSRFVLHEQLHRRHLVGAAIIIVGTGVLGAGELLGVPAKLSWPQLDPLIVITVVWVLGGIFPAALSRRRSIGFQEILFGLAAGGMAALDALLKGVAQQSGETSSFIPASTPGIILLASSFLVAAGAFGMIQWSYLRHCRASIMGTVYDLSYVGLPVLLFALLRPEYGLTGYNVAGLVVLSAGALLVHSAPSKSVTHRHVGHTCDGRWPN